MGAYLSTPNREKESIDYENSSIAYGASSMQGWRISQEDAHNCEPDFDKDRNASLYAVYDGHGGAEVAEYTAQNFPQFLKTTPKYKDGAIAQALEDAFIAFDKKLTKEDVVETLKEMAGVDEPDEDEEEQKSEMEGLYEEAEMPIEKLMERYGAANKTMDALRTKGDDFQSPALRPKKDVVDKIEAEHIKQNMSNKMLNGDHEDSDDNKCVSNGHSDKKPVKETDSSEATESNEVESENKTDSSTTAKASESKKEVEASGDSSEKDALPDSTQSEDKIEAAKSKESESKSETSSSTTSEKTESEKTTKLEADQGTAKGSGDASTTKCEAQSNAAEVSSSSEGAKSCGGSSSANTSGAADSGSGAGGSSSAADSASKDEPSSSSGRRRSKKSGVIPAEGEDESSFDEDEETSDEDELDEEDITESDSEDEDMAGFEHMAGEEEDDEEEEEGGVVYGGEEPGSDSGCTAVVAVMQGSELYVANAGDSRCVVCRNGKAVDMSIDHKPEDELERTRIERAGGRVTEDNRVNGGLNLSRALGDHVYKKNAELPLREQMITPLPDVKSLTLTDEDEFMVLACDGIWNVMSSQDVCVFVRDRFKAGVTKISAIIEEMFDFCMAPDTNGDGTGCDNMTCIIVKLKHSQSAPAAAKRRASDDAQQLDSKKAKDGD